MNLIIRIAIAATIVLGMMSRDVSASVYVPQPADVDSLWHTRAYYWDINDESLRGQTIIGAELTIFNIYNATPDADNTLFLTLLDNAPSFSGGSLLGSSIQNGVSQTVTYYDDESIGVGNLFDGQGVLIGTWHDPSYGGPGRDITFSFSGDILNTFIANAADGSFGFGIDPDCLYFNDRFMLTVNTVPEPSVIFLMGSGLAGVSFYIRRRTCVCGKRD